MIPESWQPLIAQWCVCVLGALAVTSALVHVLAPIARRVQRWTLTTSATWDDGPARWTADRLEWLSGALAVVLPMLPHITAMRDEQPAKRREPITKGPPSDGALALVLVVVAAALSSITSGCGASAYSMQARAAHLTAIATDAAGQEIDALRDHALDEVEAAHPEHGADRDAALDAEAARWRPAGQALDAIREALLTWATSIEAARALGEDGARVLWPRVLAIAAHVAALYGRIAALARELGADGVPQLPDALSALLAGAGGSR